MTAEDVMFYSGICVSDQLLQEVYDGKARAVKELDEIIEQIKKLAKEIDEEGDEELAEELWDKAYELQYEY